eukprot:TRINITY_DN61005_c0_g1_i1.p1 TRINITY_DN61005_c0_g1~~TRINITY_DN61005_c0_g1_i1.p1  ORF type:complete len:281 (-),score=59.06 TRINITY_DN61005_c0_g1_i1:228-1070(-)
MKEHYKGTKLCKFHVVGACKRGTSCSFAHSVSEINAKPDFTKTRLCVVFMQSLHCPKGSDCEFAHSKGEMKDAAASRRAKRRASNLAAHTGNEFVHENACQGGNWCDEVTVRTPLHWLQEGLRDLKFDSSGYPSTLSAETLSAESTYSFADWCEEVTVRTPADWLLEGSNDLKFDRSGHPGMLFAESACSFEHTGIPFTQEHEDDINSFQQEIDSWSYTHAQGSESPEPAMESQIPFIMSLPTQDGEYGTGLRQKASMNDSSHGFNDQSSDCQAILSSSY